MKRIISLLAALALVLSLVPAAFAEDGYIPAPYDPNLVDPTVTYMEPVFYENENGPIIGVTTVGVIVKDGLYFKDLNNNKELDDCEDWRLDARTRAADLVSRLALEDQAGFVINSLMTNPGAPKLDAVKNEDAVYPLIPKFDEKHELFIIQSANEVDSNWLRERLNMQHMKSYKTGKVMKSNVISVKDVREALENCHPQP